MMVRIHMMAKTSHSKKDLCLVDKDLLIFLRYPSHLLKVRFLNIIDFEYAPVIPTTKRGILTSLLILPDHLRASGIITERLAGIISPSVGNHLYQEYVYYPHRNIDNMPGVLRTR